MLDPSKFTRVISVIRKPSETKTKISTDSLKILFLTAYNAVISKGIGFSSKIVMSFRFWNNHLSTMKAE